MHPRLRRLLPPVPQAARPLVRRIRGHRPVRAEEGRDRRRRLVARLDDALAAGAEPLTDVARPSTRAGVVTEDWLAAELAGQWDQRRLDGSHASGSDDVQDLDVVLLQWGGRSGAAGSRSVGVPGLSPDEVTTLVERCRAASVPVVAWAIDSAGTPWPGGALADLDVVAADDAATADAWSAEAGREVLHLAPAADPARQTQVSTGSPRRGQPAAAVLVPTTDRLEAFTNLPPANVDVWLGGSVPAAAAPHAAAAADGEEAAPLTDVERGRLTALGTDAVVSRPLRQPGRTLGHYRVAGAVGGAPGSSWPLVAASMAGTPLVLDEASARLLPEPLREVHTVATSRLQLQQDTAARLWQRELTDRDGLRAARAARAGFSISSRVDAVLAAAVGAAPREVRRDISLVVPTMRADELPRIAANVGRQSELASGSVELVVVLHGLDVDHDATTAMFREAGIADVVLIAADRSTTLGSCMNLGLDASSGAFVAKMDDDNYYGTHYLTDLLDAFDYSGADIVGKWAHYVWLGSSGGVVLRSATSEHRFEPLVQGGSMIFRGDVVRDLRFSDIPRAVDTDILRRAAADDLRVYSADRFNYVSIRGVDPNAHTWPIADTAFMNRAGELVFFGDPTTHVDV